MRRMLGDAHWERLPAAVRAERRAEGATLLAELRSVRSPSPAPYHPERVTVPVVAAFGTETQPQHRRAARQLARRAPLGVLEAIDGAGHGAHLSHPVELAALVRGSLSLAPGPR
jgi:pimeloyl-ACP methyl ester carboxylesterase